MLLYNALFIASFCLSFLSIQMVQGKSLYGEKDQQQYMSNPLSEGENLFMLSHHMQGMIKQHFEDKLVKTFETAEIKTKGSPMKHLETTENMEMNQQKMQQQLMQQQPMQQQPMQQQPMQQQPMQQQPMPTQTMAIELMPTQLIQQQQMPTQTMPNEPMQKGPIQTQKIPTQSIQQKTIPTQSMEQKPVQYQQPIQYQQMEEKAVEAESIYYKPMQQQPMSVQRSSQVDDSDLLLPGHQDPYSTLDKIYRTQSFTPNLKPQLAYKRSSLHSSIKSHHYPLQVKKGPYKQARLDRQNRRYNRYSKLSNRG